MAAALTIPEELANGPTDPQGSIVTTLSPEVAVLSSDMVLELIESLQPPNEVDRLERIFQPIDAWIGSPNINAASETVQANYKIDGSLMGRDVVREFLRILYDNMGDSLWFATEFHIVASAARTKASDLYYQFKFMVDFLEAGRGAEPVRCFLRAIKQDQEASRHWEVSPADEVGTIFVLRNHLIVC